MAKKMLIDATHAEETRVVVVDGNKVDEFDFETINKRQLAGNIYLAKVTRVEPSLQAAFVDYGGNRHGFLAFSEIHPDYYQIPVADRQALIEEERAYAEQEEAEERARSARRSRRRGGAKPEQAAADEVVRSDEIPGMAVIDAEGGDQTEESADLQASDLTPVEAVSVVPEDAPAAEEAVAEDIAPEDIAAEDDTSDEGEDHDHGDDEIETVAEEDVQEEIHHVRKPRPRRYKIQEVIKVRQIMLVQVVKEERGNKGAALTTYLSLAGRYCVLMPNTARGGGISRKITNVADRKKLKEIAGEMEVPQGAGLIIRTAGSQRTKTEIRRDYEYLMRLWEQIRELTLKSVAPAPIYEEADIIKRSIRDLYSKDIDEVLVEGERGYRSAKEFMRMIMPSHAKNVKLYNEAMPLFARFQVESYLSGMLNPVVQLKSGGYLVIGVTEALVAIDVNSGRATKEGSIEETALKTNLEAAEEVARQARLRDLAGLIVIDFIDMEERKNNAAVEKRLKEKLKTDRARIQVGRISGFGLMEMSRQRLRPNVLELTTQPCPHCHGTGLIRSDDSMALQILRAIEEEGTRKRSREVLVKCPIAVANYLMNAKREHIAQIEARYGMSVRIEADPSLVSPDYTIEKFKTATRVVPEVTSPVVHATAELMAEIDEADIVEDEDEAEAEVEDTATADEPASADDSPRKKKRRRRRRRRANGEGADAASTGEGESDGDDAGETDDADEAAEDAARAAAAAALADVSLPVEPVEFVAEIITPEPVAAPVVDAVPEVAVSADLVTEPAPEAPVAEAPVAEEPAPKPKRTRRKKAEAAPAEVPAEVTTAEVAAEEPAPKPKRTRRTTKKAKAEAEPPVVADAAAPEAPVAEAPVADAPVTEASVTEVQPAAAEPVAEAVVTEQPPQEPDTDPKPKRRGWWSAGR